MGAAREGRGGPIRPAVYQAAAQVLRRWLAIAYPGSLVYADTHVVALICLPSGHVASEAAGIEAVTAAFESLQAAIEQETGRRLCGGLGRPCRAVADYRRGFAEARETLRVGRSLRRNGGVLQFDGLGATRYLVRIPVGTPAGVATEARARRRSTGPLSG